ARMMSLTEKTTPRAGKLPNAGEAFTNAFHQSADLNRRADRRRSMTLANGAGAERCASRPDAAAGEHRHVDARVIGSFRFGPALGALDPAFGRSGDSQTDSIPRHRDHGQLDSVADEDLLPQFPTQNQHCSPP